MSGQKKQKIQAKRKRKKRYYVANKLRFRIVISCLVLISLGILVGFTRVISSWRGQLNLLEVSLSQNLNVDEDEHLYKLMLEWPPLKEDVYERIYLGVGEEEVTLSPTSTYYEMKLYHPNTTYDIEFRASRRGIGFPKVKKQTIATLGSNEVSQQRITNLRFEDGNLSFEHTLQLSKSWDLKDVSYELIDLWQGQNFELESELLESTDNIGTFQITIPLDDFATSRSLALKVHLNQRRTSLSVDLADTKAQLRETYGKFTLYVDQEQFTLLNDAIDQYTYKGHHFFAESIHPVILEQDELVSYQLLDREGHIVVDNQYMTEANLGIDLRDLEAGHYFVFLNHNKVRVDESLSESWYTVTRNGVANRVTVEELTGLLALNVEPVNELPETVYDILIDPGHGGPDGGAQGHGLLEADEALKVSTYIAGRLEDHGLKVKMSRTGDYEPSGNDHFDYLISPFLENGRISQVYENQVNYVISSHLNAFNGDNTVIRGFELYSSIFTTNNWTEAIAQELMAAGHVARDSLMSDGRVSEGSFKQSMACTSLYNQVFGCTETFLDSLYMIRESGGPATFTSDMVYFNPSLHLEVPNFGAETTFIEYAYIDNIEDVNAWTQNWDTWGEAVVKATVEYLGIEYQE